MTDWKKWQRELARPFAPDEIEFKPQATNEKKTRALAVAYINARAVMDRLDAVVGAGNWSDSYRGLPNGENVECTLTIAGVSKSDVGEQNEGGFADPMKSAYSDALKRAAVKFGIGRYLYNLPTQWVGCKPQGKSVVLTETPALPAWATPDGEGRPPKRANGDSRGTAAPQAQAKRKRPQAEVPMPTKAQFKRFHALGREVYGDDWDHKREELTIWISGKRADGNEVSSSKKLYRAEIQQLIKGMEDKLKVKQEAA